MVFKRPWDFSCPKVWDSWEVNGKKFVIQDLPPEDEEKTIQLYIDHFCPDEVMCVCSGLCEDPASVNGISDYWKKGMAQRMSLACYEISREKRLVGANVCFVICSDDPKSDGIKGEAGAEIYNALEYISSKVNTYALVGGGRYLTGMGLVVHRGYRGAKIGAKLLQAREPLCKEFGVPGTATIFTGPASQISASKCGFATAVKVTWKQLADAGFKYPKQDDVIKYMYKSYN